MTSAQRDDEHVYHLGEVKVKEPKYITSPALPVKGTPWMIPPVSDEHFAVEAFQAVINYIAEHGGVSWVWVDIGCIDQRRDDPASKFVNTQAPIEIGRQARIFKQAERTYVWLCRLENGTLSEAVDRVVQHGLDVSDYIRGCNREQRIPDCLVQKLEEAFTIIFGDPWFSSLWTLQEVVLRNDAVVLSPEGGPVPWIKGEPQNMYLTMFINYCQNVYDDLGAALKRRRTAMTSWMVSAQAASAIDRIRKQILQAGFYYLFTTNPNVQYGTARYRTTTRNVDHIYAIMQIYDLRVGRSVRPNDNPTLPELVSEFAAAINERSATVGQYFLHTQDPADGATWRITEQSTVPDAFMLYRDLVDLATIAVDRDGLAVAVGSCCQFPALLQASRVDAGRNPHFAIKGMGLGFQLFFDHHIQTEGWSTSEYPLRDARATRLRGRHGLDPGPLIDYRKVLVLRLGDMRGSPKLREEAYHQKHVGLLLYPTSYDSQGNEEGNAFERLGVCIWSNRRSSDLLEQIEWCHRDRIVLR